MVDIGSARHLGYQHVDILNVKSLRWGSKPMRGLNANGFAFRWTLDLS